MKTNLINAFIELLNCLARNLIAYKKKIHDSFYISVNYERLNNLIIKNGYLFILIEKSFIFGKDLDFIITNI